MDPVIHTRNTFNDTCAYVTYHLRIFQHLENTDGEASQRATPEFTWENANQKSTMTLASTKDTMYIIIAVSYQINQA